MRQQTVVAEKRSFQTSRVPGEQLVDEGHENRSKSLAALVLT
jgi:hypothetical protein